ncbi:MAG TPA: transglutaminaseTgpA domain-containing protein, partial [Acidimicrobiales bacterium]|nr:transglutaminaseTgpA domain-containing protein [Acidimicrobiales bacterium]
MKPLRVLWRSGRSWPAEHSVALRASATGAVCVAIAACAAQGEFPLWFAAAAGALVCAGSVFSYRRRTRPLPYLKILLGAAMLGAFAWFFVTVSADAAAGQLSAVEEPLAVLFCAMQAAHAFDMPSRRDLGFSLAGSATLMALAGAQAIDLSFGLYVALWAVLALSGLHASWSSMVGGATPRPLAAVASTVATLLVAMLLVAFLPAPRAPSVSAAPGLEGTPAASATAQPSRIVPASGATGGGPASASGPTGVGGFLGFAGPLDTALRPGLGDEVVLRVRADRPTYWVAETFDSWSGRSWTETKPPPETARDAADGGGRRSDGEILDGGPPFVVAPQLVSPERSWTGVATSSDVPPGQGLQGAPQAGGGASQAGHGTGDGASGALAATTEPDYQTFYLAADASNLVLHADQATAVW